MISNLRQLKDRAIAKILSRHPCLFHQWAKHSACICYNDTPWAPLKHAIKKSKLALITTGGVHLKSQPQFDMLDSDGDPTFREIPSNTPPQDLMITHNYYDHSGADKDINIIFPIERVQELKNDGDIGNVNYRHFSFMGHIRGKHIDTLINDMAPTVASMLKKDSMDIAILTPG